MLSFPQFRHLLLLAALFWAGFAASQTITSELYSNIKSKIKFPRYRANDRVLIVNQIEQILSIYVNKESKLTHYGVDYQPELDRIKAAAETMSNEDFHFSIARMFLSLRDLHTNYYMPAPYSCFSVSLPLKFGLIDSPDLINDPIVAVKSFVAFPDVLNFNPHVKSQVQLGDILVSVNGMSFHQWYLDNKHMTGGANQFGGMRQMLNYLSARNGKLIPLPTDDDVTYELKRFLNSTETYQITVKVVARYSKACLSSAPASSDRFTGSRMAPPSSEYDSDDDDEHLTPPLLDDPFKDGIPDSIRKQLDMMELPLLPEMKELFPESAGYKSISTSEPILSWSSFEYTHPLNSSSTTTSTTHTIGIIRLDSFKPTIETQEGTIRLIRQLLLGPLSSTTALIFDCRDNGGGLISLADGIPQLFVPDFIPGGARALIAPINEQIFTGPLKNDPWAKAYSEAKPGDKYSNIIQFTPTIKANNQGQVYFKPVGVLNNGQCYSACDLFSAAMQDSGAAIIFGEDPQTGAGGANVVEHEDFFVKTLPSVFKKLPGNQNMRLAFRQSVRSGINSGQLIEDEGVKADIIVRPKPEDFYANATISSQFYTIASHLVDIAVKDPSRSFEFYVSPDLEGLASIDETINFTVKSSTGVDRVVIKVLSEDSGISIIADEVIKKSAGLTSTLITTSKTVFAAGWEKFHVLAYDGSSQVVSTFRSMRYIPNPIHYLTFSKGLNWTWNPLEKGEEEQKFIAIFNKDSPAKHGWNVVNETMVIGDGLGYENLVDSALSFFVSIPPADQLAADPGCVRPYSFWKTDHFEPAWETVLSTYFGENAQVRLQDIFSSDTSAASTPIFDLAREWLAAELNLASGSNMTSELAEILPLCRHTILNTLRYSNVSMIGATSSNSSVTSTAGDRDIITNDSTLSLAFDGGETVTRSVGSLFNTLFSYNTAASTTSSSTGSPSSCFAGRPSMYLKAEYDTEPGYDFFKLRVYSNLRQPNSTVQQIISVSGQNGTIDDWFPLQQFVGQEHLEIEIRFISDPAKTFGPIKIHQVVFSC